MLEDRLVVVHLRIFSRNKIKNKNKLKTGNQPQALNVRVISLKSDWLGRWCKFFNQLQSILRQIVSYYGQSWTITHKLVYSTEYGWIQWDPRCLPSDWTSETHLSFIRSRQRCVCQLLSKDPPIENFQAEGSIWGLTIFDIFRTSYSLMFFWIQPRCWYYLWFGLFRGCKVKFYFKWLLLGNSSRSLVERNQETSLSTQHHSSAGWTWFSSLMRC